MSNKSARKLAKKIPLFNRDLSWLGFNYRILMEARDPEVPLMERLRFLAIYSSNLDEFFRVRVAYHREVALMESKKVRKKAGKDSPEVLERLLERSNHQMEEYGEVLREVLDELRHNGVIICNRPPMLIPKSAEKEVDYYFKTKVLAYLRPQVIAKEGDTYFLDDGKLYFALRLKKGKEDFLGFVNIPSDKIERFYRFSEDDCSWFIFLDNIIKAHLDTIFSEYKVIECKSIKLNKNADLHIDDEFSGDLVKKIEAQIAKRNQGESTRFLYDESISKKLLNRLVDFLELQAPDLVPGGPYHNLDDFFEVKVPFPKLEYPPQPPIAHRFLTGEDSLLAAMEKQDFMLSFPYQSYEYVLQFFNEAVTDPEVEGINVTFYRMAEESIIGEALVSAARSGKEVNVFMEVKARFDEKNNIEWARRMKDAGANIIYSMPGLKVHAKVAQIRKRVKGKLRYYGFFGTGNLNETTARIYCDHGLFTTHFSMNRELNRVFHFLLNKKEPKPFKKLIVSQFGALDRFTEMIDREIEEARAGRRAEMTIKVNNLEEVNMINKLYEAAEAGVEIRLLVRSICCLVPGTNLIKVKRLVGRYLEHARVFYFYNGGKEQMYMGSSDWMNRNLHNRVEVSFPIYDPKIREVIHQLLDLQWADNQQGVWIDENSHNQWVDQGAQKPVSAQNYFYRYLKKINKDKVAREISGH